MILTESARESAERLAYCPSCRGVLPFQQAEAELRLSFGSVHLAAGRRSGLRCGRCGLVCRPTDPGAAVRRRAVRYLAYAGTAGMSASVIAWGASVPAHTILAWAMAALCVSCLVRSAVLGLASAEFESLSPVEVREMLRALCPGMIRSDVVDELSRRGWRIGKIRSFLQGMSSRSVLPGA